MWIFVHQAQKVISTHVGLVSQQFSVNDISIIVKQVVQLHKHLTSATLEMSCRKEKMSPADVTQVVLLVVIGVPWPKGALSLQGSSQLPPELFMVTCSLDWIFRHKTSEEDPIFQKITPIFFYLVYHYPTLLKKFSIGVALLQTIWQSFVIHKLFKLEQDFPSKWLCGF